MCKICGHEVNTNHAILVKDKIDDEHYYLCGLDCFMKWLVKNGDKEDYVWSS